MEKKIRNQRIVIAVLVVLLLFICLPFGKSRKISIGLTMLQLTGLRMSEAV